MFIETDTMAHGPPKLTPLSINTAVCVFWMFAKHWKPIERSRKTDTQTLKHANGIRGSSYNAGRGKMMIKVYQGYGQLGTKSLKKVNHRNSVQWKWIPHSGAVALDYEQKQSTLTEQSFVADKPTSAALLSQQNLNAAAVLDDWRKSWQNQFRQFSIRRCGGATRCPTPSFFDSRDNILCIYDICAKLCYVELQFKYCIQSRLSQ